MFIPHHNSAQQNPNINIRNRFFEKVAKFRELGIMVTDQNCIHKEVKSRLNSENARNFTILQFRIFCLLICYLKM
jgi:hypothetical protein